MAERVDPRALRLYEAALGVAVRAMAAAGQLGALPCAPAPRAGGHRVLCAQAAQLTLLAEIEALCAQAFGAPASHAAFRGALASFRRLHRNRARLKKQYALSAAVAERAAVALSAAAMEASRPALAAWATGPGPDAVDVVRRALRQAPERLAEIYRQRTADGWTADSFEDQPFRHRLLGELLHLQRLRSRATVPGGALPARRPGQPSTHKTTAERRGTKGRRLNYEVFEQLVNFVTAVPNTQLREDRDEVVRGFCARGTGADLPPDDIALV